MERTTSTCRCVSSRPIRSFLVTVDVSIPTGVNVVTPTTPFIKHHQQRVQLRFAPLTAGNVAGNLASGIVPDAKSDASKFVKFAPLIAGSVPVIFAAGKLVKFAPEPENVVDVVTPVAKMSPSLLKVIPLPTTTPFLAVISPTESTLVTSS